MDASNWCVPRIMLLSGWWWWCSCHPQMRLSLFRERWQAIYALIPTHNKEMNTNAADAAAVPGGKDGFSTMLHHHFSFPPFLLLCHLFHVAAQDMGCDRLMLSQTTLPPERSSPWSLSTLCSALLLAVKGPSFLFCKLAG